jgi:hypothetical protein
MSVANIEALAQPAPSSVTGERVVVVPHDAFYISTALNFRSEKGCDEYKS